MTQIASLTLNALLQPRASVFENNKSETTLDINDLTEGSINPQTFFEENVITDGMQNLLKQGFKRLSGQSSNSVFFLKQSMGGGKTHNLITLGLLAAHTLVRPQVITDPAMEGVLRDVKNVEVVAFNGRGNPPHGLWGVIAEQLGNKAAFANFYAPPDAPGQEDWEALLRGRTALILIDELPPYLEAVESRVVGDSNLARLTARALTNLMAALQRPGCERVALVLTDLGGAAYGRASSYLHDVLSDLTKETQRLALEIEPVQQNSNEVYDILRKRLFETVPDDSVIRHLQGQYAHEIDQARKMGLTPADGQQASLALIDTYPFHPSLRDLYARFRDNPGFQQTRGLIRMMRAVTAHLWDSGLASERSTIGLQDLDLNNDRIRGELLNINDKLKNALSHDVADQGRAVAEQNEPSDLSRRAATLLLTSSLAHVVDGVVGLPPQLVADYLAQPGLDLAPLKAVLNDLAHKSWYLHKDGDSYYFSSTRNINAEIEATIQSTSEDKALDIVREQLAILFNPLPDGAYKELLIFPALDQIDPKQGHVLLVLSRPQGNGLNPKLKELFDASTLRNRMMFLTGEESNYRLLLDRAKALRATQSALGKLRRSEKPNPDMILELEEREQATMMHFLTAAQEAFTHLHFPEQAGLTSLDFTGKFAEKNPASRGAQQVQEILEGRKKFVRALDASEGRKFEARVFGNAKRMTWNELLARAANTTGWPWHPAGALDQLRRDKIDRDEWRQDGQEIERGPFPLEPTSVTVRHDILDAAADRYRLTVTPKYGTQVHYAEGSTVDIAAPVMTDASMEVTGQTFTFLAVDPSYNATANKGHPTGQSFTWQAPTFLKGVWESGEVRFEASPDVEIRVTFDGSAPEKGQIYEPGKPITPPPGTHVVQAVATRGGVNSTPITLKPDVIPLDPVTPARWARTHKTTATADSVKLMDRLEKHGAKAAGVKVMVDGKGDQYGTATFSEGAAFTADALRELSEYVRKLVGPETNLHLDVKEIRFERGQNLSDWTAETGDKLNMSEVAQ
ncbi:DUF499 domain-containing protein [Deinococcus deserti]|uniref:Uncharacterized protein n=1 Tax=Deinococcus deserti (strain DSM 17065 / CIP 109153 / LMG 22923 / VCD115) TaxID=546414 RepID=C1D0X5_DEIDV|nr:DUF499 domain-containing protein [Deinococcus deserti]ACO45499.1 hypothetical protein Deide_06500 [Deinococcus deserti VCD115]